MSDTFCVLPWYSKEIARDHTTPCCLLPRNTDLTQLKKDLLAGTKSSACNTCWELEHVGKKSRRQFENIFLDYKLNKDINEIKQDCIDNNAQILTYQIYTSNLCNQACVTCGSKASTKWAELERRINIVPEKASYTDIESLDVNYKTAKRIELLGGEPLFDSRTFDILEQLAENDNTDCFISLVTNGSIPLIDRYHDLLAKFSDLNICISIDGIGPVFEYMRWPAKWSVLNQNIKQYRTFAKNLSVSYTISSLNAAYYDETVAWFQQQGLEFNHNIVVSPSWLNISTAPDDLKKYIKQRSKIAAELVTESPGISMSQYAEKISLQDRAKKINLRDYMPDLAEIIFDSL